MSILDYKVASVPKSDNARRIAEIAAEKSKKEGSSLRDLASGRSDILRVNPYILTIKDGWNSRNMNAQENIDHVEWLAKSIAVEGVREPLEVYSENGKFIVSDGHSRLLATFKAIEDYGAEIETIPIMSCPRGQNETDRLMSQIIKNSGKQLSALEKGLVFARLLAFGWDEEKIAQRAVVSISHVRQLIELQEAPEEIKQMIAEGKVSASTAWTTMKSAKDADEAINTLKAGEYQASRRGSRTVKPRDINNVEGKVSVNKFMKNTLGGYFREHSYVDNSDPNGMIEIRLNEPIKLTESEYEQFKKMFKMKD